MTTSRRAGTVFMKARSRGGACSWKLICDIQQMFAQTSPPVIRTKEVDSANQFLQSFLKDSAKSPAPRLRAPASRLHGPKIRRRPGCRYQLPSQRSRLQTQLGSLLQRIQQAQGLDAQQIAEQIQQQREEVRRLKLSVKSNKGMLEDLNEGSYEHKLGSTISYWQAQCAFEKERSIRLMQVLEQCLGDEAKYVFKGETCDKHIRRVELEISSLERRLGQLVVENQRLREAFKRQSSSILLKQRTRHKQSYMRSPDRSGVHDLSKVLSEGRGKTLRFAEESQ